MKIYLAGHIEQKNRKDVYDLSNQLGISFNRINSFFYKKESQEEIEFKKSIIKGDEKCNLKKPRLRKS